MAKKKKSAPGPRGNYGQRDTRPFWKKMVSHYANNPALFFAMLFLAVMITYAATKS